MMALIRTVAVCLLVLGAGLCLATVEQEEAPQTGTIDVEVVYTDTGEPVSGVFVEVSGGSEYHREVIENGHISIPVSLQAEPYDVTLGSGASSSRFIALAESERVRTATVSASNPAAHVLYEVERGWRLCGTVTRPDGIALFGSVVAVMQGKGPWDENAYSMVDAEGRFDMLGVLPLDTALVSVFSLIAVPGTPASGRLRIHEQSVALTDETTSADLVVDTIRVDLNLKVAGPLWPFRRERRLRKHYLVVQLDGGSPVEDPSRRRVEVDLSGLGYDIAGTPQEKYKVYLLALPANQRVTFRIETREYEPSPSIASRRGSVEVTVAGGIDASSARVVAQTQLSIELGSDDQELRLVHYEPNARLSRAFWYGVPSVLVLAVFGRILVKQMRKRRPKETAG